MGILKRCLVPVLVLVWAVTGIPVAHAATVTATFAGGTLTVTGDGTENFITIQRAADGVIHVLEEQSEVTVTGGPANVTNTDTISVNTCNACGVAFPQVGVILDLSGGPLGPGATLEGTGTSEIEVSVIAATLSIDMPPGRVKVKAGTNGINLNRDDDADVTFTNNGPSLGDLYMGGSGGNDVISARGDAVTGGPVPYAVTFTGKGGDDHLTGGAAGDDLYGGGGDDVLVGGEGFNRLFGGSGFDRCRQGERHNCQA